MVTKISKVKSKRGKQHNNLGMTLDYCSKDKVCIDMRKYIRNILDKFLENFDHEEVVSLAGKKLFEVDANSIQLDKA